jgi:hypothetical protein
MSINWIPINVFEVCMGTMCLGSKYSNLLHLLDY